MHVLMRKLHNATMLLLLLLLETPTGLPVMIKGSIKDRNWYTSTQIFSALLGGIL